MALSRVLLRVSYNRMHLAAAAVVLIGFVVLVTTDTLCRAPSRDGGGGVGPSSNPLFGDCLAVTAACMYAASNVLQERLLREVDTIEVLAAFGVLGAGMAGLQCAVLESHVLASVTWNGAFVGPLLGFAGAMFMIYSLAPVALANAGSAGFNLHMLTSDLWSAAARAAFFGGFGGACGGLGFAASLATVASGLGLYSRAPPPTSAAPQQADALPAPAGANDVREGVDIQMTEREQAALL
jgi:solute carrier family 35, member F1/2